MKRKRRRKKFFTLKRKILLYTILVIGSMFTVTRLYFRGPVAYYATNKAKMYIGMIVNDAISKEVVPNINDNEIILLQSKSSGHVTSVMINVYQINHVLSKMTADIQQRINREMFEEELKMPAGVMFNHPLLSDVGPDIAIKMRLIGNIKTDVVTRTQPYGINNSLMEVMIKTTVSFVVLIPFQQEEIIVDTYTPLFIKIIQGQVPQYYYSSNNGNFITPPRDEIGGNLGGDGDG